MTLLTVSVFCAFFCVAFSISASDGFSTGMDASNPSPKTDTPTSDVNVTCAATVSAFPPERNTRCCGIPSSKVSQNSIGLSKLLYQDPWLAQIEYKVRKKLKTLCNGALISGKYVLTVSHCVHIVIPESIRLGEYDVSNEGADCVQAEDGGLVCTRGVVRIPIEKIIPHQDYQPARYMNDIALIRMKETAPYTEFVRPICLPVEDITLKSGPIHFDKAGWGIIARFAASVTKLRVTVPLITLEECQVVYDAFKISLWKGEFCVGGAETQDFCTGDAGAPVVYENGDVKEIAGVVSFGTSGCTRSPTVNTKVYEYISWIKDNIEA